MATSIGGTATSAGIWGIGVPIVVRSITMYHTAAGAAGTITIQDGDAVAARWSERIDAAVTERVHVEFPGQGVHCSGLSVLLTGVTNVQWWVSYDNP